MDTVINKMTLHSLSWLMASRYLHNIDSIDSRTYLDERTNCSTLQHVFVQLDCSWTRPVPWVASTGL